MAPDAVVSVLTPGESGQGVDSMPQVTQVTEATEATGVTVPSNLDQQNIARVASAGASAHEHFINYGKILDFAYESDRKMVSLVEALGVRETTSKSGQTGIPLAANKQSNE